jgi:hypothetical protein
VSRHKPLWIELSDGHSAAVGVLRRGRRGFFVLGRRSATNARPRLIVASGHFEEGRVVITSGMLSAASVDELEVRLKSQQ